MQMQYCEDEEEAEERVDGRHGCSVYVYVCLRSTSARFVMKKKEAHKRAACGSSQGVRSCSRKMPHWT